MAKIVKTTHISQHATTIVYDRYKEVANLLFFVPYHKKSNLLCVTVVDVDSSCNIFAQGVWHKYGGGVRGDSRSLRKTR